MYPSDRQLQYFYTLTQFIRIIKDFERKVSIQRKSFLWWFIRAMEVANQVMFFSAMDARFLHTSMNYQRKHLKDYTVYFLQLYRTMNILLRTQTQTGEVLY